jgi:hypothetical protein
MTYELIVVHSTKPTVASQLTTLRQEVTKDEQKVLGVDTRPRRTRDG